MNNSWIGLIIALVYLVIHVLAAIDKAKKDRAKKQSASLRRQAPPIATSDGASGIPPTVREGSAVDDLSARRRQQLEELRQRRAGVGAAAPSGPDRPGSGSAPPRERKIVELGQTSRHVPRVSESAASRKFEAEQARKRNEAERARQERETKMAKRRDDQRRKSGRAAKAPVAGTIVVPGNVPGPGRVQISPGGVAVAERVATAAGAAPTRAPAATSATRDAVADLVRAAMRDRQSLRRMVVMKEVLDPPLSLRQPSR